jgi:hypothetical protein
MSGDFELFPGKNLSGLFQEIYNNQVNKKQKISALIDELKKMVRHAGDMAVIGPLIRDLIESSLKNDDHLLKLATIAQRLIVAENKSIGEDGFLSEDEKQQLLSQLEETQKEIERVDDLQFELDEIKKKVK